MNMSVLKKRLALLRETLAKLSADIAWIIQPENRRYLSGFKAEDAQITESSGSLLITDARNILVTDTRYASEAKIEAADFEVKVLKQGLLEDLPDLVGQVGCRILGFEEDYLTWGLHRLLSEGLKRLTPPVDLIPLNGAVEDMRVVKEGMEIKALEASGVLISAILDDVIAGLRPGLTEKEVAWRIEDLTRKSEAEALAFPPIVASGPNGALPHAVPTNRRLQKREPIILDAGVKFDGYCSDMTRTVFLGEPAPMFKGIYETVRQAQLAALKEIRQGVESSQPDDTARRVIKGAGFGEFFGHALGHGVGLATHEGPRLGPRRPVELKKGMVVTVEPGIYIPGKGGVRLEEMVVIEEEGPRILTPNKHFYAFAS